MIETREQAQAAAPRSTPLGRNQACSCGSGRKYKHCCQTKRPVQTGPALFEEHFQVGTRLARAGRFGEAAVSLTAALRLRPDCAEAINTLGVAVSNLGSHERAIVCYKQALSLKPDYAAAHNNLGLSLHLLGRHAEAVDSFRRAAALEPLLAEAFTNLGAALNAIGRSGEAIASSLRALELQPTHAGALLNLGNAYKQQGRYALACEAYARAIAIDPADARALNNMGEALRDAGKPAEAAAAYENALKADPQLALGYSNLLYLHAFSRDISPQQELVLARGWEKAMLTDEERLAAHQTSRPEAGVFSAKPLEGRKLRIGIVSAELGAHAVAEFLQPLLEHLDGERFHLTLFPTVGRLGPRADHLRSLAGNTVSLCGTSDHDAVQIIRKENIDVLMDTSGHTATNRLGIFARRAAPVQCTYIGYWSTTGLTEMDYFISDPDAPVDALHDAQRGFSEALWRLPRIAVCYHGDHSLACDGWKPDPPGTVWLGSFNKYGKIREETLALWAKVLHELPEGKLLLEDRGTHEQETHDRILTGLAEHGIDASRVEFIPYVPGHERHMLLYNRLDIALDTIPFNSGTTAFDALWMGVPLVALDGDWIGGRMGASVLRTLGRREWIADTHEQYAAIVRDLARNVDLRTALRATQRDEMAANEMTDAADLAHALQNSFTEMYRRWLSKGEPGHDPAEEHLISERCDRCGELRHQHSAG